jgi:hypothetical protein
MHWELIITVNLIHSSTLIVDMFAWGVRTLKICSDHISSKQCSVVTVLCILDPRTDAVFQAIVALGTMCPCTCTCECWKEAVGKQRNMPHFFYWQSILA